MKALAFNLTCGDEYIGFKQKGLLIVDENNYFNGFLISDSLKVTKPYLVIGKLEDDKIEMIKLFSNDSMIERYELEKMDNSYVGRRFLDDGIGLIPFGELNFVVNEYDVNTLNSNQINKNLSSLISNLKGNSLETYINYQKEKYDKPDANLNKKTI